MSSSQASATNLNNDNKFSVYVLKCDQDKYEVGRTTDLPVRVVQHAQQNGSEWTKRYKPTEVVAVFTKCSAYDEDKYTKKYMAKYGVDNVRGGSYCKVDLETSTKEFIQKEIGGAEDKCFQCGKFGHFASACYARQKPLITSQSTNTNHCYRCGRTGHYANECYAKTSVKEVVVSSSNEDTCYRCGRTGHYASECYASTVVKEAKEEQCNRCGRSGHYASECFAKTSVQSNRSGSYYGGYTRKYSSRYSRNYYSDSDSDDSSDSDGWY